MSRQIWSIFLVFTNVLTCICQINDDFTDSPLSVQWSGDRTSFVINENKTLQLNAPEAGVSSLFQEVTWQEEMSWKIHIEMDFNPSSNNKLRLYLFATDINLEAGDALYLEIGENGSDDGLDLYQQLNNETTLLASGTMGILSETPVFDLTANVLSDGICSITINGADIGCSIDDILVPITLHEIGQLGYFGWTCTYSSTRKDKFFFDDIIVGPYQADVAPPEISDVSYGEGTFSFEINEAIQDNFSTTVTPNISDLNINTSKNAITLAGSFVEGQSYQFNFTDLTDLSDNASDTIINFTIARSPQPGEILINEILFNPIGNGSDYIELINTTSEVLSLSNMWIANQDRNTSFPIMINHINPNELLVLTDNVENIITTYPIHNAEAIRRQSIPSWNNDDGNATLFLNLTVIDAFDYDEDLHLGILDRDDGVSLERIDIAVATDDESNWTSAASSVSFGTPGVTNSASTDIGTGSAAVTLELNDKIFSPNGDGSTDELILDYQLGQAGYVATIRVFSDNGYPVTYLLRNSSIASAGQVIWDGTDAAGNTLPKGIYILHIDMFNLEGDRISKKISFGLADFLR